VCSTSGLHALYLFCALVSERTRNSGDFDAKEHSAMLMQTARSSAGLDSARIVVPGTLSLVWVCAGTSSMNVVDWKCVDE